MGVVLQDLISIILRVGEFVFACVVAGLTGDFLHEIRHGHGGKGRFIYTEVIAALSILLSLLWLLPFAGGFIHWPVDLLLSVAWFAAFAAIVNFMRPLHCGHAFDWSDNFGSGACGKLKADEAFAFLSAIFWLASVFVGLYYLHRHNRTATTTGAVHTGRRRAWYRSHPV